MQSITHNNTMEFKTQFETLFTLLNESEYEINSPFKKLIKDAVEGAGFTQLPKQVIEKQPKTSKAKGSKGKKLSGYNLFLSAAMKGLVDEEKKSMADAVSLWQNLSDEEKIEWKDKAKIHNEGASEGLDKPAKKSGGGKRKPSGYNLFTKAKMVELKENVEIGAKDRLKEIGKQWKELTQEERDEWNVQAKAN